MQNEKTGFRKFLGLTFLIGFGFFTMGLMDPLYDTYVPIFLGKYIDQNKTIGAIMTLDNIFALFLIPIVSAWSDNMRTRIGRRMPFIIITLPLTAICFSYLPYAAAISLSALIVTVFFLNVFKQSARGPVVALMPDTIPGEYRSEANGVINTMGGIAAIIGTIGLARLMDVDIILPLLGATKDRLPFPVAGLLVILATILVFVFVREKNRESAAREERVPFVKSIKAIAGQHDKSALYILIALFLWFFGYQGVLPFIGKYSVEILKTSSGTASLAAGMVGVAYAIFAIPSGYVAHRFGRKRTIRTCLAVVATLLIVMSFHAPLVERFGLSHNLALYSFWALMFLFGMFWVAIVTNSFPMLWQMATYGNMGIYTGLYYTFSQAAAIISPPITGTIIDLVGYRGIFVFSAFCMLAALLVMGKVTRGEPREDQPTAVTD
ncbi:MAG TPA: MFS transporter [Firmicutes bacterium]|jgi:MFS family permease|nr:MFS transporter [Bacillota bacterium]HBR23592.1 MFS transporter [Bacillota bacterium]HCF90326.1 MFS transporter [Bacillota bacterium]HCM16775.1 MFS transporter [Bacillota bacterium]HCX71931.1 MFS transporter [Bacillota bacterium]